MYALERRCTQGAPSERSESPVVKGTQKTQLERMQLREMIRQGPPLSQLGTAVRSARLRERQYQTSCGRADFLRSCGAVCDVAHDDAAADAAAVETDMSLRTSICDKPTRAILFNGQSRKTK